MLGLFGVFAFLGVLKFWIYKELITFLIYKMGYGATEECWGGGDDVKGSGCGGYWSGRPRPRDPT